MFAVSNRSIILPGPDGERFKMPRGWMGPLPAWAEGSAYLAALAADGKVILSDSGADKTLEGAGKRKKVRKPELEQAADEPAQEEPPEAPAQEEPPRDGADSQ